MAQRLLAEFDTFDKYSRKILTKHAQDSYLGTIQMRNTLTTPLTFDFELDSDLPSTSRTHSPDPKSASEAIHNEQNIVNKQTRPQFGSLTTSTASPRRCLSAKPVVRPFSAPHLLKGKDSDRKESEPYVDAGFMKLKLKPKSACYRTKCAKRPNWKTKVEDVPTLDVLCQRECKSPVGSSLEHTDFSHWRSVTTGSSTHQEVSLTGGSTELHRIYGEVGKCIANKLQKDNISRNRNNGNLKSHDSTSRKSVLFRDEMFDPRMKESLKRNIEPTKNISEDKKPIVPLSIEDEMKKPNVRIVSIGPQVESTSRLKGSKSDPAIYNNHGPKFISYPLPSSKENSKFGRSHFQQKFKNESEKSDIFVRTSPVMQNNLDYATRLIENKQTRLSTSTLKKREKTKRLWSAKHKISIHILAADGTSEIVQFTGDNNVPPHKNSNKCLDREMPYNKVAANSFQFSRIKQESVRVGPVLNGMNPCAEFRQKVSSSRNRSAMNSNLHDSSSRPATCSMFPKSCDLDQMVKWNYISIAKPLKTPEYETYPVIRNAVPHSDTSFVDTLSDHKEAEQPFQESLEHIYLNGISVITGLLTSSSQKQTTLGPMSIAGYSQQMKASEKMSADTKIENHELSQEVEKEKTGGEPLQICSIRKSSIISPVMKDPVTEPAISGTIVETDNHVDKKIEETPRLTPESTLMNVGVLPIINIPTAQNEHS